MKAIYLHHNEFLTKVSQEYIKNLEEILQCKIKFKFHTTYTEILESEESKIINILQQLLFKSHPYEKITDENNVEIFQFNFNNREYLQYELQKESLLIPYIQLLISRTLQHSQKLFKNPKELKILKIIDPLCSFKSLPIEYVLHLEQSLQRISKKHLMNKELVSKTIPLLKPQKAKFKTQFTAVVEDQQIFKQLREEAIKARIKLKQSQFQLDWLDVKYQEEDFHITTSIILEKEFEEFTEIIKEYLYQAEFITSETISFMCEYNELPKDKLKKYKLKVKEEIELPHPLDKEKKCYVFIVKKSKGFF